MATAGMQQSHQQHKQEHQQQPAAAVLPWMRVPISIAAGSGVPLADVQGLHPALLQAVQQQLGFKELFPVQAAVWRGLAGGRSAAHDMCICAPTGSGKTLAYALPLLNAILTSCQPATCHVLRGLVVLPTRGLALQVHSVLHSLGAASGITVALAAAQEGVAAEAAKLAPRPAQPGNGPHVLVATPGRLMAHLQAGGSASSSGSGGGLLSLRHLRFLIVDEADRLLKQDYQGWLPQVLERMTSTGNTSNTSSSSGSGQPALWQHNQQQQQQQQHGKPQPLLASQGILAGGLPLLPYSGQGLAGGSSGSSSSRVVKLMVSATLTRDPGKLLRLQLYCPRYIALTNLDRRYALPAGLSQYRLVVPVQHKPLALVGLLHQLAGSPTLVFASSLDTTHRLQLLLTAVPGLGDAVAEYSSHVTPQQRAAALADFAGGRVRVLVTSDAMARGMDVSSIAAVVNYDPPTYAKTYVHRAGRTARAGSAGAVYTLLKPEDVVHFNGMLRKLQGSRVKQYKVPPGVLQQQRPALRAALQQVQALVQLEAAAGAGVGGGGGGEPGGTQQLVAEVRAAAGGAAQQQQQQLEPAIEPDLALELAPDDEPTQVAVAAAYEQQEAENKKKKRKKKKKKIGGKKRKAEAD